jgi:phenylpropionate dioxygenase-like ring-hydroxylating dioxygenase large terminal subunit
VSTELTEYTVTNELDAAGEARLYRALRHFWHPVAYASSVGDRPVRATLLDEQLVLVRLGGAVRCFRDLCVHRGTALSLGWIEEDQLRCAYHGWTYGGDGVCTQIPARFGSNIPSRAKLTPYRAVERNGLVYVCLEDEPRFDVPEFPEWDDPAFRKIEVEVYDWPTSASRRIENYVDFAHFAWVHDGVLGDRDRPEVPDHEVHREGGELRFGYADYVEPADIGKNEGIEQGDASVNTQLAYRLSMPNTVLLEQDLPGGRYVLFFSVCPVSSKVTRNFTFMGRDYQLDDVEEGDRTMLEFNALVIGQDLPIVSSQRPEELPYDLSAELHIRGADKVSLEYRKWLVELANELVPVGTPLP